MLNYIPSYVNTQKLIVLERRCLEEAPGVTLLTLHTNTSGEISVLQTFDQPKKISKK